MHRHLTGLEIIKPAESTISDYDDITVAKVVGKIDAPKGLGYADAYKRDKDVPGGVRKAAVAGRSMSRSQAPAADDSVRHGLES